MTPSSSFKLIVLTILFAIGASLIPPSSYYLSPVATGKNIALSLSLLQGLLWMLLAPALYIIYTLKAKIDQFGWAIPKQLPYALALTTLSIILLLPLSIFLSTRPEFITHYSLSDTSVFQFLFHYGLLAFIYYIAQSFLFFGFLFFGLWDKIQYHSFWITGATFALLHFAKPPIEIVVAFFTGILFCYLSHKTKSIFPVAVTHFIIAIITNALIVFAR